MGISGPELIAIIAASGAAASATATGWQGWVMSRSERRRIQPIILAHEAAPPVAKDAQQKATAYLRSEGSGPAFNVRFGIELAGARYAFTLDATDAETGARQRTIRERERIPGDPSEAFIWFFPRDAYWSGVEVDEMSEHRLYWCRYENAFGQTWETRNPWCRSDHMTIHRVRWLGRRERRERRARAQMRERAEGTNRQLVRGMQALQEAAADPESPPK
jgi:hypothetical protein